MQNSNGANGAVALVARIFMAAIFIFAGYGKLTGIEGTVGYMASAGLPAAGLLIYPTIIIELIGGILLLIGYQTKIAAWALAGFTILAAVFFHMNFGDQTQMIMFMKNFAIAGGLMMTAIAGAGSLSVDEKMSSGSGGTE